MAGFLQVCRSLFEKDKLLFAFMMTVHLKAHIEKSLDWSHLRFLMTGTAFISRPHIYAMLVRQPMRAVCLAWL